MNEGREAGGAGRSPDASTAPQDYRTPADADFPDALRDHAHVLFVAGRLPRGRRLAVVGSRDVDFEGARLTRSIVTDIARRGVAIVSGGAIGVDTLAHQTALREGTSTVAFLPSALDRLTPSRNRRLFAEIAEHGALVTEYPPGVSARRYHFYRRNLLIAAFADAVLVVRAREEGGTMLTARAARELGRPLLVVPGSPEDPTARGCNTLLRDGARLVRDAADIVADLGWDGPDDAAGVADVAETANTLILSENARALLAAFEANEADADELTRRCGLDAGKAMVAFLELEMRGRITKCPGSRRYRKGA